jgi:hypothetical protein
MTQQQLKARLKKWRRAALLSGLLAAVACAAGATYRPAEFYPAYLTAWLFWWSISMGSLAIAMIHHLTGGQWGLAIRRILEAAYSLMPLLGVLFVPVLFALPTLYRWARPDEVARDPQLLHKEPYLNATGYMVRAGSYFVMWTILALVLNRLSARVPAEGRRGLALWSGPGLLVWGLSVTFAAIDWAMSLEPHWSSSSYGVLVAAGQGVGAMSLAIAVLIGVRDLAPWSALATPDCLNDLGNFLLAFVMFWAYIAFTQFLIIWSGNLPEESSWYLHRGGGGWPWIAALLAGFHFAVPFLLLLARDTKRQPRSLLVVAFLLLVMRLVDWNWLVMPAFYPQQWHMSWAQVAAPIAVGGVWISAFLMQLGRRAMLPVYESSPLPEENSSDVRQHAI